MAGDELESAEVVDVLGRLVGKSLVTAEVLGGRTRYGMLETIRQYAEERLEGRGEVLAARATATPSTSPISPCKARDGLRGPDELDWQRRVKADLDNLLPRRWAGRLPRPMSTSPSGSCAPGSTKPPGWWIHHPAVGSRGGPHAGRVRARRLPAPTGCVGDHQLGGR